MDRFPRSDSIVQPRAGLQTYMAQVYGWMTVGLLLTAFVAWYAANSAAVMELLFTNRVFLIGLIIAQLALVIVLSAMIQKLSAGVTTIDVYKRQVHKPCLVVAILYLVKLRARSRLRLTAI